VRTHITRVRGAISRTKEPSGSGVERNERGGFATVRVHRGVGEVAQVVPIGDTLRNGRYGARLERYGLL